GPGRVGCGDGVSRPGGIPPHSWKEEARHGGGGGVRTGRTLSSALLAMIATAAAGQQPLVTGGQVNSAGGRPLTLAEAEAIALRNNPLITIGKLEALVAREFVRETRSAFYPQANLSVTAGPLNPGSRIAAGYLTNPIVYPRAAAGASVSQLITDFGRTQNLLSSSEFAAKAADQNAVATRQQIVLAVDQAFYNTLDTKALLRVAE